MFDSLFLMFFRSAVTAMFLSQLIPESSVGIFIGLIIGLKISRDAERSRYGKT